MKKFTVKKIILLASITLLFQQLSLQAKAKTTKSTATSTSAPSTTQTPKFDVTKFPQVNQVYATGQDIIDHVTYFKNLGSDKFSKFYTITDDSKGNVGSKIVSNDQAIIEAIKTQKNLKIKADKDRVKGILEKAKFSPTTEVKPAYLGSKPKAQKAQDALLVLICYVEITYQGNKIKIYLNDPAIGNGENALTSYFAAK